MPATIANPVEIMARALTRARGGDADAEWAQQEMSVKAALYDLREAGWILMGPKDVEQVFHIADQLQVAEKEIDDRMSAMLDGFGW